MTDPLTCRHQHLDRHWTPGATQILDICQDCQAYRLVPEGQAWAGAGEGWRRKDGRAL